METGAGGKETGTGASNVMTWGLLAIWVLVGLGCSSPEPVKAPPPSNQDVRGHADRVFDKLKQEERERKDATPTP